MSRSPGSVPAEVLGRLMTAGPPTGRSETSHPATPPVTSPPATSPPWKDGAGAGLCPASANAADDVRAATAPAASPIRDAGLRGMTGPAGAALRARLSWQAVAGCVLVVVISSLVWGVRWWQNSQGEGTGAGAASPSVKRVAPPVAPRLVEISGPFGSASAAPPPSAEPMIAVHVVGKVRTPGVVRLTRGARLTDAIIAAGGPAKTADLGAVNLARPVVDGEQIVVPDVSDRQRVGTPSPSVSPPGRAASGGSNAGGVVDLNTADAAALDTLPGVGPVLARRILEWRAQHGRFARVEELAEVPGIGERTMAQLATRVRV